MSARFDFSGKDVLVTGGSSGIGLAIAQGFRDAGAQVAITGTRDGIGDYPDDLSAFTYHQVNMLDVPAVEALAEGIEQLDVLVNNAGTTFRGRAALEPENFEATIDINLNSVYRLSHRLQPLLKASGGSIINIASMTSYFGSPRGPGYGASKSAILQMTMSLGALWARDGVRVNAIAPGWIDTKLTAPIQEMPEIADPILQRTPMGRWGRPDEMIGTALFLASADAAGFVTGVTIPVDGGYCTL
ncbi:MAG: SDR family oxidoreductase [Alphaproteobacteria bacterium]|jgi:NAD(P)-dependent dehydrogenase (short-subunit alcohol dehydrogenase family)|nr:SDR family oxidoreductase [Alphaproteobacteria bacterium]